MQIFACNYFKMYAQTHEYKYACEKMNANIYIYAYIKQPMVTWWLVGSCLKHDAKENIVGKALCALLVFFFTFLLQLKVLPRSWSKRP